MRTKIIPVTLLAWLAVAKCVGQPATDQQHFSNEHGTCFVVAWRDQQLAMAVDSQIGEGSSAAVVPNSNASTTSKICKARQPSPGVLLAIDGMSSVFEIKGASRREIWNGFDVAEKLIGHATPSSVEQVLKAAEEWDGIFQKLIDAGAIKENKGDGEVITQLHVLTQIDERAVVIASGFGMRAGVIEEIAPHIVLPDVSPHYVKVIRYGSCNRHLGTGDAVSRVDLTPEELAQYIELENVKRPGAITPQDLATLASQYVKLGADISAREDDPIEVAPPIYAAWLNSSTHRWVFLDPPPTLCEQRQAP
jgi:hypothetical protein